MRALIITAYLFIWLNGCNSSESVCKKENRGIEEVYKILIELLGNPNVELWDRYCAEEILSNCKDERVIPFLIEGTEDYRIFDPKAEGPSGNPEGPTYIRTVRHVCVTILRSWFIRNPSSRYRIGDWKEWWNKHKHMSVREIREMIDRQSEGK